MCARRAGSRARGRILAGMHRITPIPTAAGATLGVLACLAALPPAARAAGTIVIKPARGARWHAEGQTVGRIARLGLRVIRVDGDPAVVAARLSGRRGVKWAEPNGVVRA